MESDKNAIWSVIFTGKAHKQAKKLPKSIFAALELLWRELALEGPERHNWPHYGKIIGKNDMFHCHLNKGKPCYVAVWKITDRNLCFMEIHYAGTHENANYRRIN